MAQVNVAECHTALKQAVKYTRAGQGLAKTGADSVVKKYCKQVIAEINSADPPAPSPGG